MTRTLENFNEYKKSVKINGIEEKYDEKLSKSSNLLYSIDDTIENFELLARTLNESVSKAEDLTRKGGTLYTFQITKNIYPIVERISSVDFTKQLKLCECASIYFNYHKILFVFESDNSYKLRMIIHNGTTYDFKNSLVLEYGSDHYEAKLFHLIELIEDIYNVSINSLSNGIISP